MKKLLSFVAAFLLTATIGWSQAVIEIDDGTVLNNPNMPFANGNADGWTQSIYPAAMINAPAGGTISAISFNCVQTPGSIATKHTTIYMVNTSKTIATSQSDWIAVSASDKVYENNSFQQPTTTGWFTITLDNPFTYTGGNLAIIVSNDGTAATLTQRYKVYAVADGVTSGASLFKLGATTLPSTNGTRNGNIPNIHLTMVPNGQLTLPVQNLTYTSTANTATLNWAIDGYSKPVQKYRIEYGAEGFTAGTGTSVEVSGSALSHTLTGLTSSSTYDVLVTVVCGVGDESKARRITIATACEALSIPWTWTNEGLVTYDFATWNGSNSLPSCWAFPNKGAAANTYPRFGFTATPSITLNSNGEEAIAVLPEVDAPYNTILWSFNSDDDNLEYGYITDASNGATFMPLGNAVVGVNDVDLEELNVDIPSTARLAWRFIHAGTTVYAEINNISLTAAPVCKKPGNITVNQSGITQHSIPMSWGGVRGDGNYYRIRAVKFGQTDTNVIATNYTSQSYTLTTYNGAPLENGTVYNIYIDKNCGGSYTGCVQVQATTLGIVNAAVHPDDASRGTVQGQLEGRMGSDGTFTAVPNPHYSFSQWTDGNTNASRVIGYRPSSTAANYFARFVPTMYTVGFESSNATYGTVSVASAQAAYNGTVSCTATPNAGYDFVGWSNGATTPTVNYTVTGDNTLTAYFCPTGSIMLKATLSHNIAGYSVNQTPADGIVTPGQTVTVNVTAAHETGYYNTWNTTPATQSHTTGTLAYSATYTAGSTSSVVVFNNAPQLFTLTTTATAGLGEVVGAAATYYYGEEATAFASAAAHSRFVSWSGDVVSTDNPVSFTVSRNTSIVANFRKDSITVSLTGTEGGTVAINYNSVETSGTSVSRRVAVGEDYTIRATAGSHYTFLTWSNGNGSSEAAFTATGNDGSTTTINASFIPDVATISATANIAVNSVSGAGSYAYFSSATLSAIAEEHHTFTRWTLGGAEVSTDADYTFTVGDATAGAYVAVFTPKSYTVTAGSGLHGTATGSGSYTYNTSATIGATPAAGWNFVRWSDGNTENPRTFNVENDVDVTAEYEQIVYHLVLNAVNGTITDEATIEATDYHYGDVVTLTAVNADPLTYRWAGWSHGGAQSQSYTVTDNATLTATFTAMDRYNVNVSVNDPVRGTATKDADDYTSVMTAVVRATANYGYRFDHWTGVPDGNMNDNPIHIVMEAHDTTLQAVFVPQVYTVSTAVNHAGMGTLTGGGAFDYQSVVTLTATPMPGYRVDSWSTGTSRELTQTSVTVDGNMLVMVNFCTDTFGVSAMADHATVTLKKDGVAVPGNSGSFAFGTTLTLEAEADEHYTGTGWSDGNTNATRTITVGAEDYTYVYYTTINQYTISGVSDNYEMGYVTGSATRNAGQTTTLVAHANPHYHFVRWDDGETAESRTEVFTSNREYTAYFAIDEHTLTVAGGSAANGTVGIDDGMAASVTLPYGSAVVLHARANNGVRFVRWDDGNTDTLRHFTITADQTLTAVWDSIEYRLDTLTNNLAMGHIEVVPSKPFYRYGDQISLTAVVDNTLLYRFVGWSDGVSTASHPTYTFGTDEVYSISAIFDEKSRHTISVSSNNELWGTATGSATGLVNGTYTIGATPLYDYVEFLGWSDNGSLETSRDVVINDNDFISTANFGLKSYTVTSTASNGTVQGAGVHQYGSTVTLYASAAADYVFRKWSNGVTANPYTFTMGYDTVISPVFTLDSIDINVVAANSASIEGAGRYAIGAEVNLSVVPSEHHHVSRWMLNGSPVANSVNTLPAFNASVNATYVVEIVKDQVTLRVVNANPEMGRVEGAQLNTLLNYDYEANVSLTATSNPNFEFVSWTDDMDNVVSISESYSFDITAATTLVANFRAIPLAVSVASADALMGSVAGSDPNGDYVFGDMFRAEATPATGYKFKYWTPGNITANPYVFQVQAATSLTAEFEVATYTVTAVANDDEMGSVSRTPSRDSYAYGDVVTLSVSYDPARYRFVSWSNGDTRESFDTTVRSDIEMTAIFNDAFQKNITLFANGNGTVEASAYSVYEGTSVTIMAHPADTNTYFAGWDNGLMDSIASIVVTRDTIITATFLPKQRTLTVDITGNGTVAHDATYAHGTEVTLVAEPDEHVHFVEWDNGSSDVRRVVTMNGDQHLTALFRNDTVTIAASAVNGTVSVTDTVVDYGHAFDLTAIANEHYSHFHGWTRNGVAIDGSETITVDATGNGIYVATFAIDTVSLVVDVNDVQMGSVSGAISGDYTYGTEVNLTAIPAANHHFLNWNGDMADNDPVVNGLVLTDPVTTMIANFELDSFDVALTVDANNNFGSVEVIGDRVRFGHGEEATIVATPQAEMYRFVRWSDGNSEAIRTLTVTSKVNLTAFFDTIWYTASITSNNPAKGRVDGAKNRYYHGETLHVEAVVLGGNVNRFTGWSNGITTTTIDSVVTSNIVLTAIFDDANRYSVFVSSNNTAWGNVSGSGSYNEGDDVVITASPAPHYHLWHWSDDENNNALSRTITSIHADFTAMAIFRLDSHFVSFAADVENGLLIGNGYYNYGSSATVIAVPAEHYRLAYWTVDGVSVSTDSVYTFNVTGDVELSAVFVLKDYTVTATAENGSIVSGAGTYTALTPATIIAQANPNYYFLRWVVDGINIDSVATDTLVIPSVDHNTTVTAVYGISNFDFQISSNDEDMGDVIATVDGAYSFGGTYHNGAQVSLNARKRGHNHFVAWMDLTLTDTISTINPFNFTLTSDTAIVAVFEADLFSVNALSADTNMGTTTGSGMYTYHSLAPVEAIAAEGHHFTGWSDGVTTASRMVYVESDTNVTASFAVNVHTVTVNIDNPAMGSVTGAGQYNWGETVTLVAHANAHFEFLGFNNGSAAEDSISFVVRGDTVINARFDHHYIRLYTAADHGTVNTTVEGGTAGTLMPILTKYSDTVVVNAVADSHYHFISWVEYSINYDTVYDTVMVYDHRVIDTAYDTPDGDHIIIWDSIYREEIQQNVTENRTMVGTYEVNPYGFRIFGDTYVQANFAPDTYDVVLTSEHAIVAGEGRYVYMDEVTIAAVCDSHYHFVAWVDTLSGDTISTLNPYVFVIDSNVTLTAVTALDQYTLTLTSTEGGTVLGAGVYEYGAVATITAMADSGYYFYGWSDGDTSAMRQVTITSDTTFSAVFYRVGIDGIDDDDFNVHVAGTTIHVEGAAGRMVRVYDAVGRQVAASAATSVDHSVNVGTTGLYLVKVGKSPARRVMVLR